MSGAALALAAIVSLANDPNCGAAQVGSEFASRLAAIAIHESGGDPLIIGVNTDAPHGLPASVIRSATIEEATQQARALILQGRSIDLGLMQINSAQLARHALTIETALDACRSMAAGADHFAADVDAVLNLAHRRYNTGSVERGAAYAAQVEQVLARVRAGPLTPAGTVNSDIATPQPVRPPPGLEDVLHATSPVPDDRDGLTDALHPQSTKEVP